MTVRIGIIGTGLIGRDHTRRIQQVLAGAEVVALNDVDRKGAKSVQGELAPAARIYDTGRELIAAEDVDAVVVTSWGETHEEYVRASIAADKPCFCEKPLASTAAGARRIVDDEIALGKRLVQVGFMRRYDESYRLLKKAVDTEIGTPLIVHAAHRNATVPDRYVTTMAIHDTLIHEIDIFRWLLDDDYISAQVVFPRKTSNAHDRVADPQIVLLETRKGVRIDVEIFVNCQYGYDIQCQVVGEEGLANLPEPMAVVTRKNARLSQSLLTDWQDRFIDSYDVELRDFIEAAARGRVSGPSGWDGYIAAICADACVEAQNHSGKIIPIALPDCPALYS